MAKALLELPVPMSWDLLLLTNVFLSQVSTLLFINKNSRVRYWGDHSVIQYPTTIWELYSFVPYLYCGD